MSLPNKVTLYEVGPRDGLQNEAMSVATAIKVELIARLTAAGLKFIEATSFVSVKWVPQLADAATVMSALPAATGVCYPVLVPNLHGAQAALTAGATRWAIFTAASETFSQRNTHCSIADSIERFHAVMQLAQAHHIPVRGYVSCVAGCPYEGAIAPQRVAEVAAQLLALGVYEVSLGDTIGVGNPRSIHAMLDAVSRVAPIDKLAIHCHDTYGQALVNVYAALEHGIAVVDSSVAGLGGCPYAPGASGNVATEDVLYLLQGLGLETGVDLDALVSCAQWISATLGREPMSRVAKARSV
jgi:hydroxymethylglutaryl-CoA lyase